MRNWLLSLAALALIASPAFAGKYNKTVSVGDKAPALAGIPAAVLAIGGLFFKRITRGGRSRA